MVQATNSSRRIRRQFIGFVTERIAIYAAGD
jgi:hypothetical protein